MSTTDGFEQLPPSAAAMIESMRAFGYSPGTAIADIVDNSLAAGASNVWLRFIWAGSDSRVSITDDGAGMHEDELRRAMRMGSRSPRDVRAATDLGRFGLGLKTASLSQCRRLTVASKVVAGTAALRCWDLDHIARAQTDRWELRTRVDAATASGLEPLDGLSSGTIVLWEALDRLVGRADRNNERQREAFFAAAKLVTRHLGMVFHRYLEGPTPRLAIHTGGERITGKVEPWDPFLSDHLATHEEPSEEIETAGGRFEVTGFVLPHKDLLTRKEFEDGGGIEGWTAHQGFYVYRNGRLLVPGGWLGLGRPQLWSMQAHYSLARLRIDLPNTMDDDWQIDVRKSTARVPREARDRLTELADIVRNRARSVFAHRAQFGARQKTENIVRAWTSRPLPDGRTQYRNPSAADVFLHA